MLRGDFAEWFENKTALGKTRVRDGEFFALDDHVVIEQDVEIKGARAPANDALAFGFGFDDVQAAQERERVVRGFDEGSHIEIRALVIGAADGLCFEYLRVGDDTMERIEREPQIRDAVAKV